MRNRIILMLIMALFLAGCASYDFSRRNVQQGNLLPKEKIERLKIGMSKQDAAILMGTSLLSPLFTNDRWDYAYTWREGNGPVEKKSLSLYFAHGRLAKIESHS
ncbi:small protein A [Legionella londiniensis]|uniref:TmRNA-binding small protein A n=1 Tax=Legionella londiniensis TaxID=45068 RepID=A0A0W0VT05_9GAMM|nr:outer membrane protein assembly factor BamE [Legionella londiniensis]KTD23319.1 tmRNA-binding small protein A [Legionella londiniensis]STX94126.1 small protein A [Legionella londiniensis]